MGSGVEEWSEWVGGVCVAERMEGGKREGEEQ